MQAGARDIDIDLVPERRAAGGPWAVALNETAATDDVKVTLLALAVVDDIIRISGIVQVVRRPDVRFSNIPALTLAMLDGPPLGLLGAHVLPNGRRVWVSWTYERPAKVCTEYEGRIDGIDLAYRAGGVVQVSMPGPWVFRFAIPKGRGLRSRSDQGESA
jgi:hypothetical protein